MKKLFLFFFTVAMAISAQEIENSLTGILYQDGKTSFAKTIKLNDNFIDKNLEPRSPFLAGTMSFLIPGAGQLYNGDIWKTLIFAAVEAAGIAYAVSYNNKGNDKTDEYEEFANQNWSVNRYADWTVNNATRINPDLENRSDIDQLLDVYDGNGNVVWDKLNTLEGAIGSFYSHQLEEYGEQQYYEMIGKYSQFNPGWNDFTEDPDDPFTFGDPVTANFKYYSDQRGQANEFFNNAKNAVIVVIINHILSAGEAAWSSSRNNSNLNLSVDLKKSRLGFEQYVYPELNLQLRL